MTSFEERLAGLTADRQALLARLLGERRAAPVPEVPRSEGPRRMSAVQWQFYLLWQQDPEHDVYSVPIALRLRGALDEKAAWTALREVVRRHEILRTRYPAPDGDPVPVPGDHEELEPAHHDLSDLPAGERKAAAERLAAELARRPFDLAEDLPVRATLIRLDEQDHVLLIEVHHIAIDAPSTRILFAEFTALYTAACSGADLRTALPELPLQYADYAAWEQERAHDGHLERGLAFWDTYLRDADTSLDLPTDRPRPARPAHVGGHARRVLPRELTERLRKFSTELGVTPFMTVLTALGLVLRRQTGKRDVLIGTSASNRPTARTEELIGCFVNTLVLRVRTPENASVRDALHQVREDVIAAFEHQDIPFEKVVAQRRPERAPDRNPLFQVMFVNPKTPWSGGLPGVRAERFEMHNGTAKFDLEVGMLEGPDRTEFFCEYDADVFTQGRVDGLLAQLEQAVVALAADPDAPVSSLSVLGAPEQRRAALEWNATAADHPVDRAVARLIAEQAASRPEAPAVVAGGETLTYAGLDRRANRLARLLAARGLGPGSVVGVAVERTLDLPVCVLAVLKCGAAYLPLDPSHPRDRLALMLTDSRARAVLTGGRAARSVPDSGVPVLVLDELEEQLASCPDEPLECPAAPDDLCYVIFTSGSTGRPKAVMLDQRGRINNFTDFNRRFEVGPGDAVLSVSSLGFDMTAYDVIGTLMAGATLVLPDPARERDPGHWLDLIREHRVTIWHSVPALLGLLVDGAADLGLREPVGLRVVLLGGDWIPLTLPDRIRALSPDARVIGLGGATEASMDSTLYEIGEVDPEWRSIPYGRPMANQLAYVLDAEGHLVPPGVPGELFLGGAGLAWGYLHAPDRTADRFVPNPFSGVPGDRMYRTGDLARYRPDGVLELLGRIDFQVKIAGNRIELGEVEAALRALPGVGAAVAAAPRVEAGPAGRRVLVGYLVAEEGTLLDPAALREQLCARLPGPMVPSELVVLDAIPLTANGKVARGGLPLPGTVTRTGPERTGRAPATPTERALAAVWSELLGRDAVSADESFFALGGDSVTCVRMVTRARAAGLELTPRMVFQHQTVGELAAAVDLAAATPRSAPDERRAEQEGDDGLAPVQRHMLAVARRRPVPGLYVMQSAFPLPGALDDEAFRAAWQWLFDRHPILRTCYRDTVTGRPRPVTADRVEPPLVLCDLRGMTPREQQMRVLDEVDAYRLRGFDLESAPLVRILCYRLTDDVRLMVQQHHYSVLDGWSWVRLRSELLAAYEAFEAGTSPALPDPPPYGRHARRDGPAAVAYWRDRLEGSPGPWAPPPPAGHPAPRRPVRLATRVAPELFAGLERTARERGITFASLVQLAWARVLADRTGIGDVVFGVTVSGRLGHTDLDKAVGPFVNTLPVRFVLRPGEPAAAAARRLHLERSTAEEHGGLGLGEMTQGRDLTSVLVFDNFPGSDELQAVRALVTGGHPLLTEHLGVAHTEFPVRVDIERDGDGTLAFTFAPDRPLPDDAHDLGPRLLAALEDLRTDPDAPLRQGARR
ncbi:amino acid adenylation domain-containing protein [Streptomyces sp. NPDC052644]